MGDRAAGISAERSAVEGAQHAPWAGVEDGGAARVAEGLLPGGVGQGVGHRAAGVGVRARGRGGDAGPPGEAGRGGGTLRAKGVGQVDLAPSGCGFGGGQWAHGLELRGEAGTARGGPARGAVGRSPAAPDRDRVAFEVDVLDAHGEGRVDPQARAVEERAPQANGRREGDAPRSDGRAGEHGGEGFGAGRGREAVAGGQLPREHPAGENDPGAEGRGSRGPTGKSDRAAQRDASIARRGGEDGLNARRDTATQRGDADRKRGDGRLSGRPSRWDRGARTDGQRGENGRDLRRAQVAGRTPGVDADEGAFPGAGRFRRVGRVVLAAQGGRDGCAAGQEDAPGGGRGREAGGWSECGGERLRASGRGDRGGAVWESAAT